MSGEQVLRDLGLLDVLQASGDPGYSVNDKLEQTEPYKPELDDLVSLGSILLNTSRPTVLEFGCGWSSLVMAAALSKSKERFGDMSRYRRNNPFECHALDNQETYIEIAKSRIPERLRQNVVFHFSKVRMTLWESRIATEYEQLPLINPDFIYLDGPDQFAVEGEVSGWNTGHKDLLPMSCDILKIEHFLIPKTVIVVDGRAANARFLKSNLQRDWEYKYCPDRDQHFFVLEEPPLGRYSRALIEEIYYSNGTWGVADL